MAKKLRKNRLFAISVALLTWPFVLGCVGNSSSEDTNTSTKNEYNEYKDVAEVDLDLASETIPIDENTYGQFIEHIGRCIYNGIWSEMISDRKFYSPIGEDVSQWKKGGKKEVISDKEKTYSGAYAPKISQGSSIYQRGISLAKKDYDGYFYARGSGILTLKFLEGDSAIFSRDFFVSSLDYSKFSYSFANSLEASAMISFETVSGTIQIDSPSLMPSDNYYGMRKDTLDQLKKLNAPFYRWPGGNFVSGYSWKDGIGERDKRASARNLHYAKSEDSFHSHDEMVVSDLMRIGDGGFYSIIEPNDFGLDEFIKFCRYLDAEPNIVVNAGLGSASEAADEVTYCNAKGGGYANKRPQEEPYGVKYFSIGNEMFGDWQLGHVDVKTYIARHCQFYDAMKKVDPSIKIIMVGENVSSWTKEMLKAVDGKLDYISEHFYGQRDETNSKNHIANLKKQTELRIKKHRELGQDAQKYHLAFDEYAYDKAEVASRMKDGMGVAAALNSMIYSNDVVDIACYSSTVNAVQGSVVTTLHEAIMEGNGYILSLYRNHFEKNALPISTNYQGDNYFELAAALSEDKKSLTISVINATDNGVLLSNSLLKGQMSRAMAVAKYLDSNNTSSNQEIAFETSPVDKCVAPGRAVSIFTIHLSD